MKHGNYIHLDFRGNSLRPYDIDYLPSMSATGSLKTPSTRTGSSRTLIFHWCLAAEHPVTEASSNPSRPRHLVLLRYLPPPSPRDAGGLQRASPWQICINTSLSPGLLREEQRKNCTLCCKTDRVVANNLDQWN